MEASTRDFLSTAPLPLHLRLGFLSRWAAIRHRNTRDTGSHRQALVGSADSGVGKEDRRPFGASGIPS